MQLYKTVSHAVKCYNIASTLVAIRSVPCVLDMIVSVAGCSYGIGQPVCPFHAQMNSAPFYSILYHVIAF